MINDNLHISGCIALPCRFQTNLSLCQFKHAFEIFSDEFGSLSTDAAAAERPEFFQDPEVGAIWNTEPLLPWSLTYPLKNGGWKTSLSYWVSVTFQGRAVKLQGGSICLLIKLNVIESLQDWIEWLAQGILSFLSYEMSPEAESLGFYSVYTYPIASMYGTFTYTLVEFLW